MYTSIRADVSKVAMYWTLPVYFLDDSMRNTSRLYETLVLVSFAETVVSDSLTTDLMDRCQATCIVEERERKFCSSNFASHTNVFYFIIFWVQTWTDLALFALLSVFNAITAQLVERLLLRTISSSINTLKHKKVGLIIWNYTISRTFVI